MSDLLEFDEAVAVVVPLLGSIIRPHVYRLHDGTLIACLAVDPDVAFAALREQVQSGGSGTPS